MVIDFNSNEKLTQLVTLLIPWISVPSEPMNHSVYMYGTNGQVSIPAEVEKGNHLTENVLCVGLFQGHRKDTVLKQFH